MNKEYYSAKRENSDDNEIMFPSIYFSNAVKDVLYTMAGLDVIETKPDEEEDKNFLPQISGVVLLTGERNIMLSLSVSNTTAFMIVSFMTGLHCTKISTEELCDGICEIANMIAGQCKAQLSARGYRFCTLPPFAVLGSNHSLVHKSKVENITKKFRAAENDIFLKVYFI